jgi:hypothetical protein
MSGAAIIFYLMLYLCTWCLCQRMPIMPRLSLCVCADDARLRWLLAVKFGSKRCTVFAAAAPIQCRHERHACLPASCQPVCQPQARGSLCEQRSRKLRKSLTQSSAPDHVHVLLPPVLPLRHGVELASKTEEASWSLLMSHRSLDHLPQSVVRQQLPGRQRLPRDGRRAVRLQPPGDGGLLVAVPVPHTQRWSLHHLLQFTKKAVCGTSMRGVLVDGHDMP